MSKEHHTQSSSSGEYKGYPLEEAFIAAYRSSARKYSDLCDRIGERFHEAQQEAYYSWSEGDEAMKNQH